MRIHGWLWCGATALAVAGCGGGGPECGPGTVEEDGECVPESTTMCGAGTVDDGTGNCVLEMESSTCGAGTTLNPATGECVADVECGTGTMSMGGECVPDGTVICADGTIFDDTTGTCMSDGQGVCAEGTMLIDGECVLDDDTLVGDVMAAAEQDDPDHDGTPATFTPPAVGEELTIEGCITPTDIDGDGTTDVDRDFFAFTVSEPGLYRINADGLGGLAAGFAVEAQDGPLDDQGWARLGLNYSGDTAERRVYLPRAGDYYLYLFDTRSFDPIAATENGLDIPGGFIQPVGGAETCYFVTIEAEAVPTATTLPGTLTANGVLGDPLFYTTTATGDTIYRSVLETEVGGIIPGQALVDGDQVFTGIAEVLSSSVADGESLLVVVDHIFSVTMDPAPFTLTLSSVPQVPVDGTVTITYDADDIFQNVLVFEANEGDVVHLTVSAVPALRFVVTNPSITFAYCGLNFLGQLLLCPATNDIYFVVESSGPQQVILASTTGAETGDTFEVTTRLTVQTPADVTLGTPVDVPMSEDARTFVRADLSASVWTSFELSALMGAGFTTARVGLHDDLPGLLTAAADDPVGLTSSFGRIYGPTFGESVLIELADPVSWEGDEQVTLTVDEETYDDVTVAPGTDVTQTGVTVPAGEPLYYFVRGDIGGELTFTVTGATGTDAVLSLLDRTAAVDTEIDETGDAEAEVLSRVVGADGFFAFAVSADGGGTVDVSITQAPPPYSASAGSTTFASVCPGAGTGTELIAEVDDGLSAVTTFATLSGFDFFATPATGFRASTNGWMTLDTGYTGDSAYINDPLGTADEPNSLIASLWNDLATSVCVLEEATRLVVEWNGTLLGSTDVVQMQVILDATSDTIELVYGPGHQLGRVDEFDFEGTIGIENDDASIGIGTGALEPVAGTSILFTPAP